jgi:multicomponent K+:H+ antiporter subunit E
VNRLIPSIPLSLSVFVVWLLLVGSLAFGDLLMAAILAVALPLVTHRLRPGQARMRRPLLALRFLATVLWDIVLANIEVARRILGPESAIRPQFIWLPLDITNPYGIAALAGTITMTPGTVSAELTEDRKFLLVHCFNLRDEAAQIAQIKQRYEAPLREIFP